MRAPALHRLGLAAIWAAALVTFAVVVLIDLDRTAPSYGSTSGFAASVGLMAGLALLAAGIVGIAARRPVAPVALAPAIATSWWATDIVGWAGAPPLVRSLAMVATAFVLPLVVHVAAAFATARPTQRTVARLGAALGAVAYGGVAATALVTALVRDPFLDLYCWNNCTDNVFVVAARPELAHRVERARLVLLLGVGAALVAWCAWWLLRATRVGRRQGWCVLVPAAGFGGVASWRALVLLVDPAEDPGTARFMVVYLAAAVALLALGLGWAWAGARAHRSARSLARLTSALDAAPAPGALRAALRQALGDDTVEVAYRVSDLDRWVDASGAPAPIMAGRTTTIVRDGRPVARVSHDGAYLQPEIEQRIGSALRLAIDNARMRAELLAQVAELRASRQRIVEVADGSRRRIERDLHDGAQQRLLGLSYEIRLALGEARRHGDDEAARDLAELGRDIDLAIDEVRVLARGIFPSILYDAGLAAAVRAIADEAAIPVDVDCRLVERCGTGAEMAAYVAVADSIEASVRHDASHVAVRLDHVDGLIAVRVGHDGRADLAADLMRANDRVGALGGRIAVDDTTIEVLVPCASS